MRLDEHDAVKAKQPWLTHHCILYFRTFYILLAETKSIHARITFVGMMNAIVTKIYDFVAYEHFWLCGRRL
jgi:hypothetical protein